MLPVMKAIMGERYIRLSGSTNCKETTWVAVSSILLLRVLQPWIELIPFTVEWPLLASECSRWKVHNRLHWGLMRASSNICYTNSGICTLTEFRTRLWRYSIISIHASVRSGWATGTAHILWGGSAGLYIATGSTRLIALFSFARTSSKIV